MMRRRKPTALGKPLQAPPLQGGARGRDQINPRRTAIVTASTRLRASSLVMMLRT